MTVFSDADPAHAETSVAVLMVMSPPGCSKLPWADTKAFALIPLQTLPSSAPALPAPQCSPLMPHSFFLWIYLQNPRAEPALEAGEDSCWKWSINPTD